MPTDSHSLQEILHKAGINMRYLGELHKAVSAEVKEGEAHLKGDFKHLKAIFEREVVLRCAKHVIKHYLRD